MRRNRLALLLAPIASAVVLILAGGADRTARAGGPVVHDVAGRETLAKGELEGLSLDAEGTLRLGSTFASVPLDADSTWAAARLGDDIWIGTGNGGNLLRVKQDGKIERISTGDGLLVTALTPLADGTLAAAVFPGARLLKVDAAGKTTPLATLPVEHIWALEPDGRGGLVAATGLPGALFAVDAFGAVEKLVEVGDDHARCLVRDQGALLVGTAPKGLVLSIENAKVRVLRDLAAQEVVAVVPARQGGLLIAANADSAGGNAQAVANLLTQITTPPETKPGQKVQPRASLQDGTVLWLEPSGAVTTLWAEAKVAALALSSDGQGGALVGTYPSGRVFRVEPGRPSALYADFPEAEASLVVSGEQGLEAVVTSNPAVLQNRVAAEGTQGTWTSAPIDAGADARWGRAHASGAGIQAFAFRSGETEEPDTTWTGWQKTAGFDASGWTTGARARFLQMRVTLAGEDAALRSVSVVAAAPNRTPTITEMNVTRKGEKKGQKGPPTPNPVKVIDWKAEDPDGDRLRVALHARRDGSPLWITLVEDEVLAKPQHEWDTSGLPDGVYVLRLVLSDAPDNTPARVREATRIAAPLRVDNTAPHLTVSARVAGEGRLLLSGEAKDQPGGRIAAVRVSVDGGPWRVLAAADDVYDTAAEAYEGSLPLPASGAHDIVVQARDSEGNVGAAATTVTTR